MSLCSCGNYKSYRAKLCNTCYKDSISCKNIELGHYVGYDSDKKSYSSGKCQQIRKDAYKTLTNSDREKVCAYCKNHDFDSILEVHHIKGIMKFDRTSKISEINSLDNLIWLCPNHHAMLEKGIITLSDLEDINEL